MSRSPLSPAALAMTGGGLPSTRFGQILHEPPADQGTGTAPVPAVAPLASIDPETLQRAIAAAVAESVQQQAPARSSAQDVPVLNPTAGAASEASEEARELTPRERARMGVLLHRLFRGQVTRDGAMVAGAIDDMARAGFYGAETRQAVESGQRSGLNTLSDGDGGVFLPEVVIAEVLRIAPEYGVLRRLARVLPVTAGTVRIPNLTSGIAAFWIGEGATIKARKAAFGKVTLDPEKMGVIVPWTNELQEEAGPAFMDLIVTLIAEAFGYLEDTTGFYGDGTSTYGGITGLATASGVNVWNLGGTTTSGKTNFNQITRDDLIGAMKQVHPSVRRSGTWVFHPDTELTLSALKDSQGRPIYIDDYRGGTGGPTLLGRPVEYAQAAYAESATAVSKVLGFYGDFSRFLIAQGRGMTSTLLDQATITDVDDSTLIHLGAQDMRALRVTQRLDMLVALPAAFVRLRTAAS